MHGLLKMADKETWLKTKVDSTVMEMLRAISVSSSHGRIKQTEMVRVAVQEYIDRRIGAPEVQKALASIRGQPLHLYTPTESKAQSDT
jgi:hypothetical protein